MLLSLLSQDFVLRDRACYVAQAGLQLKLLGLQPPEWVLGMQCHKAQHVSRFLTEGMHKIFLLLTETRLFNVSLKYFNKIVSIFSYYFKPSRIRNYLQISIFVLKVIDKDDQKWRALHGVTHFLPLTHGSHSHDLPSCEGRTREVKRQREPWREIRCSAAVLCLPW